MTMTPIKKLKAQISSKFFLAAQSGIRVHRCSVCCGELKFPYHIKGDDLMQYKLPPMLLLLEE